MTIGERIRAARKAAGLRQSDLASRLHVGQGRISDIETGRHGMTLSTLHRIALALGCEARDLLP